MFKLTQDVEKEKVFRRAARRYSTPGLIHCHHWKWILKRNQLSFSLCFRILCVKGTRRHLVVLKNTHRARRPQRKKLERKFFSSFPGGGPAGILCYESTMFCCRFLFSLFVSLRWTRNDFHFPLSQLRPERVFMSHRAIRLIMRCYKRHLFHGSNLH